jgi:hypothetical protein
MASIREFVLLFPRLRRRAVSTAKTVIAMA